MDRNSTNQLALVVILKEFSRFFFEYVPKLDASVLKKWDSLLLEEGFAKQNLTFCLSKQCIFGNRLYLHEKRLQVEKNAELQRILREELIKKQTVPDELELTLEDELLDSQILNVEEACIIIQCAERMYQAVNRYLYLVEVRQKAMEIRDSRKMPADPEKAIIRIQANTRGFLARKRVSEMRTKEHLALGLKLESWFNSNIENRRQKHASCLEDFQPFFIPIEEIAYPENLRELIELLRSNVFVPDPLKLEDDPPLDTFKRFDEQFVKQDCYVIVEFDGLEMFHQNAKRKSPIKTIIRNLLLELLPRNCQIIGMSRHANLEPEILSHFDVVYLKTPAQIERYELIASCLSRRMEEQRLTRVPQRLYEISKATKSLNCGQTVGKVDLKFAAKGAGRPK
uniref:Uncharacterized protein n=1 Tax=Acrobeloides nanus TaxID=290746 RepID=A0A914CA55_9BILA